MISSSEEFISLRNSERQQDYLRAATDCASIEVWLDVINRFPEMRIWVAHNKMVPVEALLILSNDLDPDVRAAVAMKNKLSEEMLSRLAKDPDDSVRERVVFNKNTSIEIFKLLENDPSPNISDRARQRLRDLEGESR
jgi:hypothetical protein